MKIKVKVHPNASKEQIIVGDDGGFEIWIKEKPIDNKVNIRLVKILGEYLKKSVSIKSGFTSRIKTIEILD